jgi:hypothetical protein
LWIWMNQLEYLVNWDMGALRHNYNSWQISHTRFWLKMLGFQSNIYFPSVSLYFTSENCGSARNHPFLIWWRIINGFCLWQVIKGRKFITGWPERE